MVSVCFPSDALLQHLPSYLGFSYLGHGISLHGCSSKAQPLLLTLDEGYLLTTTPPDLEHGVAPLGLPVPAQPPLLGRGVVPLGHHPWPQAWGSSLLLIGTHMYLYTWRWWKTWIFLDVRNRVALTELEGVVLSSQWNPFPVHTGRSVAQSRNSRRDTDRGGKPWSDLSSVTMLLPSCHRPCRHQTRKIQDCC